MIGRRASAWAVVIGLGAIGGLAWPGATETAVANGDTRTINLYHAHTHESISATYMVGGQYDPAVLDKLNWFLRDWRRDEPTKMEPRLFDIVWQVYRESGSQQPIEVMSAYRSPETNAMLRRRSRGVAEHSQHILGRAMDQHYMDVPMSRIRELGMKLQRGGVGFYPTAGTPFVHLDAGGVRHWPRMNYDQLARLFPDGKTVHIPSNGQPLPGYEEARAELEARGDGSYPTASQLKSKGFFAWLFGGGGDEEEDNESAGVKAARAPQRVASLGRNVPAVAPEVDSYGKNDRGANVFDGGFLKSVAPATPAPVAAAPARAPREPVAAAPPPPPAPDAQQTLARAMLARDAAQPQGAGEAQAAAAPVAELPVPGEVMEGLDPARPPTAPLPPRRPVELAALGPDAPVPPTRPPELSGTAPHDVLRPTPPPAGRPDPVAALIEGRPGSLPDVITRGTAPPSPVGAVLGYAPPPPDAAHAAVPPPAAVPFPAARPATLVSTTLDRSNFRSLTRPDSLDRSPGRSALGATIAPIRAASRSGLDTLVPLPTARPTLFQSRATDLSTDRFSGLAGRTPPRGPTRVE